MKADDISDVQYKIGITISECRSQIIKIIKTIRLIEGKPKLRTFITKDNKTIEYYPTIIIDINNEIFTDMITKKKEY
jgi:hypothetical protein